MIVSACIPQRLGDDRGSNRPSLRRQRLGRPAARDGHVDVSTGEGVGEGLVYLTESYNRIPEWRKIVEAEDSDFGGGA